MALYYQAAKFTYFRKKNSAMFLVCGFLQELGFSQSSETANFYPFCSNHLVANILGS